MNSIVYCTTNTKNGKKYIGSHNGKNPNYLGSGVNLNEAIKKYGRKNFIRQTLWEGPSEFRYEMEEYWILYFDAVNNQMFYNATEKGVGAGWIKGKKRSKESQIKRVANTDYKARAANTDYKSKAEKCKKPIIQYDLCGNFIKKWSSATEAACVLNLQKTNICAVLKNKRNKTGNFIFMYDDKFV
jgi:hypothetical protein